MISSVLQGRWADHRTKIMQIAIALMIIATSLRVEFGFSRLLGEQAPTGAIDLKLRYDEVHSWFAGRLVYGELKGAMYPPASYVIFWPFLGWSTLTSARWLWAATTVVALGWFAYLIVRESRADTLLEGIFVGLLPFSMYATSVAIGNGQFIIPLLPALVASLVLLHDRQRGWQAHVLAAVLVLLTLVSPTIAAPFFWIVMFVPNTLWPAVLVSLGYSILTLLAMSFQGVGLVSVLHGWSDRAVKGAVWGSVYGGYANLHSWLAAFGLQTWNRPASLLALAALGVWIYCHRHRDLWCLLGVTALVSRLWTYHRLYDDLLIVLPMITLFRIAKQSPSADGSGVVAGVLLAAGWVAVLSPPHLLLCPPPWNWLFQAEQTVVWVAVLAFLLDQARREKIEIPAPEKGQGLRWPRGVVKRKDRLIAVRGSSMSNQSSPEMSVIIVTDHYQTIRKTIRHLRTQTVKDRLEIVIVAPSVDQLDLDDAELKDFLQVRVVEVGPLHSLSWARAPGVRQASAPVVGFVESHSYPSPVWAEALIEAHRQPWAAVGPAVNNANPGSMISWANFLLDYGRWFAPAAAAVIDDLPGHNSSYKRQVLVDYGSELEAMLEAESILHWDLQAKGYRLYLEPRAQIVHLNISLPSSWVPERYYAGRRFAAARAQLWSPLRRLLYVSGSPLIPLVRLPRILRDIHRSPRRDLLPRVLPALIVSLVVSAVGEMIGYAFRSGDAMEKLSKLELNKIPHLAKRDRQATAC